MMPHLLTEADILAQQPRSTPYIHLLDSCSLVSDIPINDYAQLIKQHSKRKIYVYDSQTWLSEVENVYRQGGIEALRSSMQTRKTRYEQKERKRVDLNNRQNAELIFMPINCHQSHWILGVIDLGYDRLWIYDSLQSRDHAAVLKCMKTFAEVYLGSERDWKYSEESYVELPHQGFTIDCGIYVMAYMRAIAHNKHQEIDFSRSNLKSLRALFLYELCTQSLDVIGI